MHLEVRGLGAVALLDAAGNLLTVADMPVLRDGPKNRTSINAPLLVEVIFKSHAAQAFVEHVAARPGEGAEVLLAPSRSGERAVSSRECVPLLAFLWSS